MKKPEIQASWEINLGTATKRFFRWDAVKVMLMVYLLMSAFFIIYSIIEERPEGILQFMLINTILCAAMGLLFMGIYPMMVNAGYPAAFALTREGIFWTVRSRRGTAVNRLSLLLGVLDLNPSLAGAALLAKSKETGSISWGRIRRVKIYPRLRTITIMNSWRVVIRLYNDAERFDSVAALVRKYAAGAKITTEG
jgi:hypothetical protein